MKSAIQRFGAAMFVPVLLFPVAGMLLGLSVMLLNKDLFPFAVEGSNYVKVVNILLQSALAVFKNMSLVFVLGLPIALASKASGRAVLASFVSYITFNYFVGGILQYWGDSLGVNYVAGEMGLTEIGGILTLDTSLLGAIVISGITVAVHNKYFDKKLPDWASVLAGTPLVVSISFPIMLAMAIVTCFTWPSIQNGIQGLQQLMLESGTFGVWLFTFLERLLIPTGLHHFIYGPVFFGPVAVDGGTVAYWIQHISEFAANPAPLSEQFPQGGLMLTGMGKVFGCTGIALALFATAKLSKKKMVLGLVLGAAITAILTGITEPLEFTFLFVAPILFVAHAVLSATMAAIAFTLGISGNFQSGMIDFVFQNWLPLFHYHGSTYVVQMLLGLSFTVIYFLLFRGLILKFNLMTPGRDDGEVKLYSKQDFKDAQAGEQATDGQPADGEGVGQAQAFINGLGGKDNIETLTNCATRLRVKLKDVSQVQPAEYFQAHGAVNLVNAGEHVQIIVGLTVPQVREEMSGLL